ncbi:hypothetical protein CDIK_2131 [Cucumispora dikerogammari]|nr:hypothetical protein CDIK_2131 [Cucumispora dikerogammari]
MINGNLDEVKWYLGSRYVSAMEAAWIIFKFPVLQISHSIIGMGVNFQDRETTNIYVTGFGRRTIRNVPRSKLEAFFQLMQIYSSARVYIAPKYLSSIGGTNIQRCGRKEKIMLYKLGEYIPFLFQKRKGTLCVSCCVMWLVLWVFRDKNGTWNII